MIGKPQPTSQDTAIPTVAPNVSWVMVGGPNGFAVPDGGNQFGPIYRDQSRGMYAGYQHGATGALISMMDITARVVVGDQWRATAEAQLTGPGRDAYIAARSTVNNDPPAVGWCAYVGYKFISADPNNVSIEIASACPSGNLLGSIQNMAWVDGDWRLTMTAEGKPSADDPERLTTLEGFTTFAQTGNSATGRD
jgi:hypothetical protein